MTEFDATQFEAISIEIRPEVYDRIKGNALKNTSRSSIIYLPDENDFQKRRRYKVNLDEQNNLYIKQNGKKVNIYRNDDIETKREMCIKQILYIRDELPPDEKERWEEFLDYEYARGLRIWVNVQLENRKRAEKSLSYVLKDSKSLKKFKDSKLKEYQLQLNKYICTLLVSIIKFDIQNITKNLDILKEQSCEFLLQAEQDLKTDKVVCMNSKTGEKIKSEQAYLEICNEAKEKMDFVDELVRVIKLDPWGPSPEQWPELDEN